MGKGKKKGSKKIKKLEKDVLDVAAESVRKFRRVTKEIGKLSTTQKVFGGVGLLAAAITYLTNKQAIDQHLATSEGPLAGLLGMGNNSDKSTKDDNEEVADKTDSTPLRSSKSKVASKAPRLGSKTAS
ncbi:hypothetical protein ACW9KT_12140 [Hymenobacter sp. HD11105]|jgi:hypothetical protein